MAAAGETGQLPMLQTSRFVGYEMNVHSTLVISTKDPNNPRVSELPIMEVFMRSHGETSDSGKEKV